MTSVFAFNDGRATNLVVKVDDNSATVIVDGTQGQINVPWFRVSETAGGTQTLTVDLYDTKNAIAYCLGDSTNKTWTALAVTAKQSVLFGEGYVVPTGFQLRVTSGAVGGGFDVTGIKIGRS